MTGVPGQRTRWQRAVAALRIGRVDPQQSLFELRRIGTVPPWAQLVRRHPNWLAIAVSSLLFGVLHLRNIYWLDAGRLAGNVVYAGLVIGPVLGYVALRCRSVWPAVILHYANNLSYYLRQGL